jgi:ferredoxin-NADP reductase
MEKYIVKISSLRKVTHDVLQIKTEKPDGFGFIPGQATEISINKPGWVDGRRPFTFTCLPSDPFLEFTIKTYPVRKGVTNELLSLNANDELILHDVFGTINYQGEGIFIAGGAGVTPFISILRSLNARHEIANNKLLFANKTKEDIILEDEFRSMLKNNFVNILSDEQVEGFSHGFISESFLKAHMDGLDKKFYVCGPDPMMDVVLKQLTNLGVPEGSIVMEVF